MISCYRPVYIGHIVYIHVFENRDSWYVGRLFGSKPVYITIQQI